MGAGLMARVFISYSSKSREVVRALAQDFEGTGYQVWFDHKLTGGQAWWDEILANIRQCDLFVFALTPEALDSYPCKLEYTYADALGKTILPVLLTEGVSINLLPPELTKIQFVDYRQQDKQAAFNLMKALNNLPEPAPLPDPLPEPPPVPISYIGNLKTQIDASASMTFEEQASLVFRLKEHLQDKDNRADAISLLRRLRRRSDLFARIAEEIDTLLQDEQSGAPAPDRAPARDVPAPLPQPAQQQFTAAPALEEMQPAHLPREVPPTAASGGEPWSNGMMIALAVGTFFIPLIGIIMGIIGLRNEARKNQSIGLLVFGIVMFLIYSTSIYDFYYWF
jgi:hypothetical protein